jgi:ribonuclease HI
VDGASSGNPGPAGIGIVVFAGGRRIGAWQEPVGVRTNNEAEYLALKRALELALERGARQVEVRLDSELVYRQVRGEYRVLDRRLQALYEGVRELASRFEQFEVRWVPRQENAEANRLAQQAARTAGGKPGQPEGRR